MLYPKATVFITVRLTKKRMLQGDGPSSWVNARKSVLEPKLSQTPRNPLCQAGRSKSSKDRGVLLPLGEGTSAYEDVYLSDSSHRPLVKCGQGLKVHFSGPRLPIFLNNICGHLISHTLTFSIDALKNMPT